VEEYSDAEKTYLEILREFPNSDVSREVEYGLAWSYFQQKKYEEAYDIFDQLSDGSDSIGTKSFYWKGESMRYAGRENEAFKIFNEFLDKYPNSSLAAGVQYQMGALYYNSDRFDQAGKYLSYATGSNEADIQARSFVLLGDIALSKKQFEPARKNFESAINIPGINLNLQNSAMLGLGVSLFYLQKYKEALPYLTDVDYRDPSFESDKLNFYLAETDFALGKFQEALSRYQKVDISNEEVGSFALYGRAYSYFSLRDYGNAALQFADFIKKFPNDSKNIDARLRLADSYYGSRNFASASRVYKELFKVKSGGFDDPNAQYQYAQALYKAGSISDAIKEFRDLQARFPNSEFADRSLYVVGWIYFQQGNFNEAISNYRNVLRTYPRSSLSPIIYYSIGDAYFNIGRYDSAIVNYQKLLTDFPSSNYVFDAVNGLQYSYVAQGNPERAIALIDEFVSRNPGLSFSDQVYFKKGEIYYSQRSYELAKQSYKEFAGNYPKSKLLPDAYYWIGKSAQNLQQHEEAVFNFNRVFEMNPNSETGIASVLEIGNIHNAQKNYDAAISIYDRALSKIPPDSKRKAEVLYMKGLTLINKGNPTESYPVFEEVAQYYPGTIFADKAKFEVALIELSMGRYTVADQYFKNLAETRTDDLGAQSQYYYGLSLLEQNKINEAISAFVRVRTVFGGYDEWLARSFLKMGEAYTMLDDNEKAKEMYRAVLTKHKGDSFGQEAQAKLRELQ
jgi:TolA-binding protein